MAKILETIEDSEKIEYEQYLEEARKTVDPSIIPDDDDGETYMFFRCMFIDNRNHNLAEHHCSPTEELRLAAEAQVICELLTKRESKKFAIA